jgi:hypothetical protein
MSGEKKIVVRKKLPIRVVKKFPIKVKERPADEPAMSMFQRAVEKKQDETPEQRRKREAFERRADDLRKRMERRGFVTRTRLPYRHEEATLFSKVFTRSPLMFA